MAAKSKKKKTNWLFRLLVIACLAFVFVKFVQTQVQINRKQEQIRQLEERVKIARLYNEDLTEKNENYQQYVERRLRDEGYVYLNDQVYQFAN